MTKNRFAYARNLAATLLWLLLGVCPATRAYAQARQRSASSSSSAVLRVGVVVGTNRAVSERRALRYAHRDARSVARVLQELGDFRKENLFVLLEPSPKRVLAAIDRATERIRRSKRKGMLFFYYSGHSDADALYPRGQALPLDMIRKRLANTQIAVRVGLIDACRGGGWTGSKGLSPTAPFQVDRSLELMQRGSVLISSSSGLEDAHESEVLKGSFFTHHFVAGLRGAADRNKDGAVSFSESFEYAKRLTIRDTAVFSQTPQHPSFHIRLRGRKQLPLSRYRRGKRVLSIEQRGGPIQVIHLETGLIVAETESGAGRHEIALPQGKYLVRKTDRNGSIRTKEITLEPRSSNAVRESELRATKESFLFAKSTTELNVEFLEDPTGWARAELVAYHTTSAATASALLCAHFGCRKKVYLPVVALAGVGGAGLALHLTRKGVRPGEAVTLNSATSWGIWTALSISGLISEGDLFLPMAMGQVGGLVAGLALNHFLRPVVTDWALANSMALWSSGLTALIMRSTDGFNKLNRRQLLGTYLGVSYVSGAVGFALGHYRPMSRSRGLIIDGSGILGGLVGAGIGSLVPGKRGGAPMAYGLAAGFGLAGLGLGAFLTRNWDFPSGRKPRKRGVARPRLGFVPQRGGGMLTMSGAM